MDAAGCPARGGFDDFDNALAAARSSPALAESNLTHADNAPEVSGSGGPRLLIPVRHRLEPIAVSGESADHPVDVDPADVPGLPPIADHRWLATDRGLPLPRRRGRITDTRLRPHPPTLPNRGVNPVSWTSGRPQFVARAIWFAFTPSRPDNREIPNNSSANAECTNNRDTVIPRSSARATRRCSCCGVTFTLCATARGLPADAPAGTRAAAAATPVPLIRRLVAQHLVVRQGALELSIVQHSYLVAGNDQVDLAAALTAMATKMRIWCVVSTAGGGLKGSLMRCNY